MPAHKINASGICRIGAAQNSVNIGNRCGFGNAGRGLLDKLISLDLEAVAALAGILAEFAINPVRGSINAFTADGGRAGGKCLAGVEAGQLLDVALDLRG